VANPKVSGGVFDIAGVSFDPSVIDGLRSATVE
jgi:hypothetical protein